MPFIIIGIQRDVLVIILFRLVPSLVMHMFRMKVKGIDSGLVSMSIADSGLVSMFIADSGFVSMSLLPILGVLKLLGSYTIKCY